MQRRYQIEDHIQQDASGIVFRAFDTETGRPVALRRFFPFGPDGGGLLDEEQSAYNIAIGRLAGLQHPALRSVISGGCDPVDGMPFIATEWVEGDLLDSMLESGPLPAEDAALLLTQALEVCELLSHVLAEEAVWVETDPHSIVRGDAQSGRSFTFWISPLKWLGGDEQTRGLQSIIDLAEQVMGWQGKVVSDQAGRGLGAWLNWLRSAEKTHLREVRENLAAAIGEEPPPPAKTPAKPVVRPLVLPSARKSSMPLVFGGLGLALVLIGLSGWLLTRKPATSEVAALEAPVTRLDEINRRADELSKPASRADGKQDPQPARKAMASEAPVTRVDEVNRRARELSEQTSRASQEQDRRLAWQAKALESQGGVYTIAQGDLLATQPGKSAQLRGRLAKIESSDSGATLYLYFSRKPAMFEARGAVLLKNAPDIDPAALEAFIGKEIRITGNVGLERNRPEINITRLADIQPLD